MATMIDWHAHHTAPEIADRRNDFTEQRQVTDASDSTGLGTRGTGMDGVVIDLQLVCQGGGVYADKLAPEQALENVRQSNDILAQRIAPHKERLLGVTALSLKN